MKKGQNWILGLSALGWIVSLYTLWHKIKLEALGNAGEAFCNINAKFNCDSVALSTYSEFLSFPVSVWGMFFFSLVVLGSFLSQKEERYKKYFSLLLLSGLVFVLYLAFVSAFALKTFCITCLFVYLIVLVLSALYFSKKENLSVIASGAWFFPKQFLVMSLILLLVQFYIPKMMEYKLTGGRAAKGPQTSLYLEAHFNSKKHEINEGNAPFVGTEKAPLVFVEYSDFQCPYCARSSKMMPVILKQYADKIKYVYKNYPLDASCNPQMEHSPHVHACLAAKASLCVNKISGVKAYTKMKEKLYENQKSLSLEQMQKWAQALEVNLKQFNDCLKSSEVHETILAHVEEAKALGVEATPTHFLNGRLLRGALRPEVLQKIVSSYLKEK